MTSKSDVSQQDIEAERWEPVLSTLTKDFRGAHARLEVLGSDIKYLEPTENQPFEGISADTKDGERVVWISFGAAPDNRRTHSIHKVRAIHMLTPDSTAGAALEVEAEDGTKTILTLSNPGSFSLPPAQGR
jgi:hypothetical protein